MASHHGGHTQHFAGAEVRSQQDRQIEMDHRTPCQLQMLCHFRQFALERERVYQHDPRATWMEQQVRLDMGCCTGTLNNDDVSDSANFEFSTRCVTVAVSPPGCFFFFEMVASKVVSRVQRFHVALAEKAFPEPERLAQEFLATEHWRLELSAQAHLNWRSQAVVCCLACHVRVSSAACRGP